MADDQNTAAQAAQGTPPAEGSETSQVESQVQTQDEKLESQPEATSENQNGEEGNTSSGESDDQSGQEGNKPSRVERRIQSLISKVKEAGSTQTSESLDNKEGNDSFFTEEELGNGEIDPKVLQERIQRSIQAEVQRGIQMDRINQQYESTVREHQADLESVTNIDPELEAEAIAEYEVLNYQINPMTGEKMYVPAVKLSEIVNKIQARVEKLAEKKAQQIAEGNANFIKSVSSSQAVPTSGRTTGASPVKADTSDFSQFEKHYSRKS